MSSFADIPSIDDLEVENQRVFIRADLDAPTNKAGEILDDQCIAAVVPTIKKLQSRGAQVIVGSRFGDARREESKKAPPSIEPAAARLSALLCSDVLLPDACEGDSVKKVLSEQRAGQVCVLENLATGSDRGPESEGLARRMKAFVDIYVADSLRVLSEESATTTQLPRLCDRRAAGVSLMRELSAVARVQSGIDNPRLLIWGGNSLSARLDVLTALLVPGTSIYLAGVAANTLLHANGLPLGRSAVEADYLAGARTLFERLGSQVLLPKDFAVGKSTRATERGVRDARSIQPEDMILDLGDRSITELKRLIGSAKTVIWCGSVGFFKSDAFSLGTRAVLESLAKSDAFTMVIGEDSVSAAHALGGEDLSRIDCVSLGATSTLALLKNNKLPGLVALSGSNHE